MKPDAAQMRSLRKRDPVLADAMQRVPRFPGFPDATQNHYRSHFHALARSICYQQITGVAARTIHDRVCALTPGAHFPRPEQVLELSEERMRGAGLSRNKYLAIRDLAERVCDGRLRLRGIARRNDEAIIEELVQVRGIGVWSAQMFLIFRLGRLDVMPATDLGVQEGVRRLDDLAERPGPNDVMMRAEVWAPLRSVASWVLWRLADAEL